MKRERPLFSVIISCYNSGDYLDHMLTSLCHQGIRKDELEVIISDDCSPISYDEVLDKYRNKLNIREIRADHNWGYPMHTREQGVSIATGEWITFADHDDAYIYNAFKKIKKYIKKENPQYAMYAQAAIGDFKTKKITEINKEPGITHGEFFNLDNFWKKYDIHYDTNIQYFEDIYLNNSISVLAYLNKDVIKIDLVDFPVYIWYHNPKSLGFEKNSPDKDGRFYIDRGFNYYPQVTFDIFYDLYMKSTNNNTIYDTDSINDFIYTSNSFIYTMYIMYEAIKCKNNLYNIEPDISHDVAVHEVLQKYKSATMLDIEQIISSIDDALYIKCIKTTINFCGYFHSIEGLESWLRRLDALEV